MSRKFECERQHRPQGPREQGKLGVEAYDGGVGVGCVPCDCAEDGETFDIFSRVVGEDVHLSG